jgi:glutamate mutase epsilon subunit
VGGLPSHGEFQNYLEAGYRKYSDIKQQDRELWNILDEDIKYLRDVIELGGLDLKVC